MFLFRKLGRGSMAAAAIAVLFSALLPAAPAFAQTTTARPPLSLMTSPLPLNVVTKPGQTVTADLRVKNNGTTPEVLKIELLKFGASGDTGRPQLMERDPQDVYFNWISFSENTFTAEPNVWKTIKMTIKAPKEAAFGYYYAVLFSRAVPDRPTGNQSAVEGGVASLVLLNVDAPGARREAQISALTATRKVYEFLPAKFSVKLHNSGNVHVSPVGTVFIKRGDTQVAVMNFNDERGNILPGTNRIFDLQWSDGFPAYVEKGEGSKATKTLDWDFSKIQKLRFGRYTATLVAVYDDGQRDVPIEAIVSFWVIPWRILGIVLLIILLVGIGVWGIGRLIWKNIRRQASLPSTPEGPDPNSLAAASKKRSKKAAPAKPAKPSRRTARAAVPPAAQPKEQKETVVYEEEPVVAPRIRKAVKPEPQPAPKPTPRKAVAARRPAAAVKPAPKPVVAAKPVVAPKPVVATKPAPPSRTKPVAKPVATARPAAKAVAATKPVATPKPAAVKKAVAKPTPAAKNAEAELIERLQQLQAQVAELAAAKAPTKQPAKRAAKPTAVPKKTAPKTTKKTKKG